MVVAKCDYRRQNMLKYILWAKLYSDKNLLLWNKKPLPETKFHGPMRCPEATEIIKFYRSLTYSYHYNDVIMVEMAFQITSLQTVYLTVYSSADQRKHQSSASLAFVLGIHRWPVDSPYKWPVTRKMFLFDDVIIYC